jgi:hypothetical protein
MAGEPGVRNIHALLATAGRCSHVKVLSPPAALTIGDSQTGGQRHQQHQSACTPRRTKAPVLLPTGLFPGPGMVDIGLLSLSAILATYLLRSEVLPRRSGVREACSIATVHRASKSPNITAATPLAEKLTDDASSALPLSSSSPEDIHRPRMYRRAKRGSYTSHSEPESNC